MLGKNRRRRSCLVRIQKPSVEITGLAEIAMKTLDPGTRSSYLANLPAAAALLLTAPTPDVTV